MTALEAEFTLTPYKRWNPKMEEFIRERNNIHIINLEKQFNALYSFRNYT